MGLHSLRREKKPAVAAAKSGYARGHPSVLGRCVSVMVVVVVAGILTMRKAWACDIFLTVAGSSIKQHSGGITQAASLRQCTWGR